MAKNKIVGKVSDYEVSFEDGLFTCCMGHVMDSKEDAFEGMIITCDDCGQEMILSRKNGVLMWRTR